MTKTEDADAFLFASYDEAEGRLRKILSVREIAAALDWDFDRAVRACQYLAARGYVEFVGIGGAYSLTIHGATAVEELRPQPDRQAARLQFLMHSMELSDGDPYQFLNMWKVGETLGWEPRQTVETYEYLAAQGLLQARALGGDYSVTDAAIDLLERATTSPHSPSAYFPPLASLKIQDSTIVASNVASPGASVETGDIVIEGQAEPSEVAACLAALKQAVEALNVDRPVKLDALADVEGLMGQAQKSDPSPGVLRALWESLSGRVPDVISKLAPDVAAALTRWVAG